LKKEVNKGVSEEIHECLATLIDWLVEKTNRHSQSIASYLTQRNEVYELQLTAGLPLPTPISSSSTSNSASSTLSPSLSSTSPSSVSTSRNSLPNKRLFQLPINPADILGLQFHTIRQSLLHDLQKDVRNVVTTEARSEESTKLIDEVRSALFQTAAIEVGALGFGALFATALFDWTGIAGAGMVALGGLYVLPYKRSRLKTQMRERIATMQKELHSVNKKHFEKELENSVRKITSSINPYGRFVRTEHNKLDEIEKNLSELSKEFYQIRHDVRISTESLPPTSNTTQTSIS